MIVFYDPNGNNQVMAVYSGDTNSLEWERLGYIKVEVPENLGRVSRDSRVTMVGDTVVAITSSINPMQPDPIIDRDMVDWARVSTVDEKLAVIARRLRLE